MFRSCLLWLIVALFVTGCGPTKVVDRLPDGQVILIRSPQPDEDDIREFCFKYGLRTIINLRGPKPEEDWHQEQVETCREFGIELVFLRAGRAPPSQENQELFLSYINDPSKYPILIHCQGGVHRTGTYVALYRLVIQKWQPRLVLYELEQNWFDWTLVDRESVKDWIKNFQQ